MLGFHGPTLSDVSVTNKLVGGSIPLDIKINCQEFIVQDCSQSD